MVSWFYHLIHMYMLVIPDCMLCANAGWSDPDLAKKVRI